jgi:putative ATP-dependent endonuclease of OLD family
MLLKNIKITGLRSIKAAEMLGCGGLNVLIGKNNAGKSNLLSAIIGFFNIFAGGDILDLRPIFSQDVDYFDRDTSRPIEIACCFAIGPAQTADIVSVISRDYPPVRNVVAALSESRYLKATVKYFYTPSPFALLTTIALNSSSDLPEDSTDTIVYRVTDAVAPQLEERFRQASKKKTDNADYRRALTVLDPDVYAVARRDTLADRPRSMPFRIAVDRFWPGALREEIGTALDQDF